MEFFGRSRFYIITLVILLLSLLSTSISASQAAQPTQEEIWNEIQKLKVEIAQLKNQVARLRTEVESLKGQPTVEVSPLKKGQVPSNKVFRKIPGWKVTLTSYERLEGGGIKFNFLIENLQDKPANFCFCGNLPYLLDDQTNKYYNAKVSPKSEVTLIPNMPVEGHITFTQSELSEAKVIVFYFEFSGRNIEGWNDSGILYVGPIKLR